MGNNVASKKTELKSPLRPSVRVPYRLVESDADLIAGVSALTRTCPFMGTIKSTAGIPALRRNPPGFLGLCRIVVFQQVSVASGTAIWTRVQAGIRPFTAPALLSRTEDDLRGLGLSRPKVRTLRALAEAIVAGAIDLDDLAAHPDATIREKLVALHGIGPWTADIFLMFNLGRADAFASGDLALQEAARMGLDLDARPDAQALEQIAERWRPWRAVAALMLWNYYRVAKQTKGGAPV